MAEITLREHLDRARRNRNPVEWAENARRIGKEFGGRKKGSKDKKPRKNARVKSQQDTVLTQENSPASQQVICPTI
jgi:hypothetical protein